MKKILTLVALFLTFTGFAQYERNPFPKTITVTGSAEMEVIPDQIYVQVDLKEYEKKGQGKISIDKIKGDFLNNLKSLKIPDSAITIASYEGYNGNPWIRKKNKKDELMASITYQVILKSSRQMDDLVNILDDNATQNFLIIRATHSRMEEFKKQLKIAAVKAAKEKAAYLAEAINEKAGEAITINEPNEMVIPYNANILYKSMIRTEAGAEQDQSPVDFKKIHIKYDVTVVFALK